MASTRRDFIQLSTAAASAVTLGSLGLDRDAPGRAAAAGQIARDPAVRAFEAGTLRARPVPLDKVRLTGGPLKHAQDVTAAYLLGLEPDRMLAYYRVRAGLAPKAEGYTGWDGDGRNLTGHIAGHHLSAVSLMYAATGDARFKARADYLVRELKDVQDAHGDGYLSALEGCREAFAALADDEIRAAAFDLNGLWSPWYTLHKTYAGLRDAYRHAGNDVALELLIKFSAWAEGVLAPLSDDQVQRMLLTEFGGMNEVFADLYADTGDRRWLDLSRRFEHHAFTGALERHQDNLNGKHGNTQIPKLIGSAVRYGYAGDPADVIAAAFFWDRVAQHHSYATGGHSYEEYLGPPDQLARRVDGRTAETCNVYNMLKLTRRLFALRPDALYADFQERALFNHILASIDPEDGATSYMVPVGRGVQQEYQNMQRSFTCCVGSGMESHALHGDGLYYESDDAVWVNLFVPSTAELALGARIEMQTDFPDGDAAAIRLTMPAERTFTLAVRRPSWAGDDFRIRVNGQPLEQPPFESFDAGAAGNRRVRSPYDDKPRPGVYVELTRAWRTGDTVEIDVPKTLRLEPTPDDPSVTAIMWGPLVLAADHGPRRQGRGGDGTAVPALVAAGRPLADWITPTGGRAGDFTATGVGRAFEAPDAPPVDVALAPFFRTHQRRYSVYMDFVTPDVFEERAAEVAAERERVRRLEDATVAFVRPGSRNSEGEFNYQSEPDREPQRTEGRTGRGGRGWFSYDLPVDATAPMTLLVTYWNRPEREPTDGEFVILVDNQTIARFEPNGAVENFWDAEYAIPAEVVRGKTRVTVRFQADQNGAIAPVYGVRMIRADR
jgi:DUF1680 family protein